PGRRALSLFGSDQGLGVFAIDDQGSVTGAWLDDFHYDRFRTEVFEPWEVARDQALRGGTPVLEQRLEALSDRLLDAVGGWLERGDPPLAAGGEDLVVIPHRLFRHLPVPHTRVSRPRRPF